MYLKENVFHMSLKMWLPKELVYEYLRDVPMNKHITYGILLNRVDSITNGMKQSSLGFMEVLHYGLQ